MKRFKKFFIIISTLIFLLFVWQYFVFRPNSGGADLCAKISGLSTISDIPLEEKTSLIWKFQHPVYWVYKVQEIDLLKIKDEAASTGYSQFDKGFFKFERLEFENVETSSKNNVRLLISKTNTDTYLYVVLIPR